MARLRYVDKENASPEVAEVFQKLEGNGAKIINLYRMLGHSRAACLPFLRMGNSLLTKAELDSKLREMAILRVATLTGADYEWKQHVTLAREIGITEAQIEGLRSWEGSAAFDEKQKAVLRYVDEMVKNVKVGDEAFANLQRYLNDTEVVELTISTAYWHLTALFLVALQIDLEETPGTSVQELTGKRKQG
ncbi:MAG: carboxymuconolactone decarboxylase family protein [Chloroflexi bacterium]|nr:carboxymuconolactone decarboxylase family protein [Chloroflexota bacterium]